ncbi:MAG: hypothetical protein ACI8ZN_001580 [Bacteroidia bacterium]|jgi:uncharacterized protein YkwD
MKKACLITVLLFTGLLINADTDEIDVANFKADRVEEMVLKLVNEARLSKQLAELMPDGKLKKAAADQAAYMKKIGKLSHHQTNVLKSNVRKRVELYGGSFQGLGENTASLTLFKASYQKSNEGIDEVVTITTYSQLAKYLFNAWYFSPHHQVNMLYNRFTFSGLSMVYDDKTSTVYAVEVMGYPYKD